MGSVIKLLDQDINLMKGDLCYIYNKHLVFPQITQEFFTFPEPVSVVKFLDGAVVNNKPFVVFEALGLVKILYGNLALPLPDYRGSCIFGDKIFVFYNNKCIVIDTNTNTYKTITISEPSNIASVYQISSQLFAIITTNPTTVFIYSLTDAGDIANAPNGSSIALPSYSYSTFAFPKQNPKLLKVESYFYLYGDDATVVLDIDVKDLIYIRTLETYYTKISMFPELESKGLKFVRESFNAYYFYNTLMNSYVAISKGNEKIMFSTNWIWLSDKHVLYFDKVYELSELFDPTFPDINLERSFFVKFKSNNLSGVFINFLETKEENVGVLSVVSRFYIATENYTYQLKTNNQTYKLGLKGEEFLLGIISNQALRISEILAW